MEYTIGKRQRTSFLDERGRSVDGYRIYFTMDDGTVDYVEIAKNLYSAESVKEAIEAAVEVHASVIS